MIIVLFVGTSVERTISSLNTIGAAVFNGGFTTFLALVLLGFSTSHVFISFFKVKMRSFISLTKVKITNDNHFPVSGVLIDCGVWIISWPYSASCAPVSSGTKQ